MKVKKKLVIKNEEKYIRNTTILNVLGVQAIFMTYVCIFTYGIFQACCR